MTNIRIKKFLTAFFISLIMFLGIGSGHSFLMQQAAPHGGTQMNHKTECQSACSLLLNHKLQIPQVDEDDIDPNPIFSVVNSSLVETNYLYILILIALLWASLRQRPPDLTLLYANLRN